MAIGNGRIKQQVLRTLVVLALGVAAIRVLHNLITPVLWAGLIAIATWPLEQRLSARRGKRARPWIAALLIGLVVCVFVLPFGYVVFRGWHEVPALLRLWTSSQESGLPAP
ncbi:MAG: AI-2E family transporter, partial [Rhizobacter sp.]|nr:AI-2E family transporter [Rhizobacter sp.]